MFYLLGNAPHSFSPLIHNTLFKMHALPYKYQNMPHLTLPEISTLLQDPQFKGASITIPFKQELAKLTTHNQHQYPFGINTVLKKHDQLVGYNTDIIAIRKLISQLIQPHKPAKALILGAGATGQAMQLALDELKIPMVFYNRTQDKAGIHHPIISQADQLCQQIVSDKYELIVNTLPEHVKLKLPEISPHTQLFEVNYHPLNTRLLEAGGACKSVVRGIDLLIEQGFLQNELFTGNMCEEKDNLRKQLVDMYLANHNEGSPLGGVL